jgi:hypothetical protein
LHRSNGNFDARLNGALLLPTVPIQGEKEVASITLKQQQQQPPLTFNITFTGEFEALLGHVGLTISVRMLKYGFPPKNIRLIYSFAS